MNNYEIIYIINPQEQDLEKIKASLLEMLNDPKELKVNIWGLRKFVIKDKNIKAIKLQSLIFFLIF